MKVKRILSLLLAAAAVFCMYTISVSAAEAQISPRYTYLSSLSANISKGDGYITYNGDCVVRPTSESVTLRISLQVSSDRVTWTEVDGYQRTYPVGTGGHGWSSTYYSPVRGKYYRCLTMVWVGNPENPVDSASVSKLTVY